MVGFCTTICFGGDNEVSASFPVGLSFDCFLVDSELAEDEDDDEPDDPVEDEPEDPEDDDDAEEEDDDDAQLSLSFGSASSFPFSSLSAVLDSFEILVDSAASVCADGAVPFGCASPSAHSAVGSVSWGGFGAAVQLLSSGGALGEHTVRRSTVVLIDFASGAACAGAATAPALPFLDLD